MELSGASPNESFPAPARHHLIQGPTPLHRLDRISSALNAEIWIKRDDLTGFAMGGNKGRKLEYLVPAIQKSGADIVVTCGAAQSNFVRQLAAACSVIGVRCAAVLMDLPYDLNPIESQSAAAGGNLVLDEILGLEVRNIPNGTWERLYDEAAKLAGELEAAGTTVYRMPIGGSSPLGAYAFYEAANELPEGAFDAIVFASSSGSTHTGLAHAFRGKPTRVLGIACDPEPEIAEDFAKLSLGLAEIVGGKPFAPENYDLNFEFVGPGYGVPSEGGNRALQRLARTEGIILDPIYSAKAFDGLLTLIAADRLKGRILFWHTGGLPALFAY